MKEERGMKEDSREDALADGWRCAFLPRAVGGSKRGSIMFRQFGVKGKTEISGKNPGVWTETKKGKGGWGG